MYEFEVTYQIPGSGAGMIHEIVRCASDYNARRYIMAKFSNAQIFNVRRLG